MKITGTEVYRFGSVARHSPGTISGPGDKEKARVMELDRERSSNYPKRAFSVRKPARTLTHLEGLLRKKRPVLDVWLD